MDTFTIYGKENCQFCVRAKRLLEFRGLEYTEVKLLDQVDIDTLKVRIKESGSDAEIKSVPQVFCGDEYIGGYNELRAFMA